MQQELNPKAVLSAAAILLITGTAGVSVLVLFVYPTVGPRWFFYFFILLAFVGLAMPPFFAFNRLLKVHPDLERPRLQRESLGAGVYGAFLVWLSIGRLLTLPLALLIAAILVTVEYLLRLRENDLAKPNEPA